MQTDIEPLSRAPDEYKEAYNRMLKAEDFIGSHIPVICHVSGYLCQFPCRATCKQWAPQLRDTPEFKEAFAALSNDEKSAILRYINSAKMLVEAGWKTFLLSCENTEFNKERISWEYRLFLQAYTMYMTAKDIEEKNTQFEEQFGFKYDEE